MITLEMLFIITSCFLLGGLVTWFFQRNILKNDINVIKDSSRVACEQLEKDFIALQTKHDFFIQQQEKDAKGYKEALDKASEEKCLLQKKNELEAKELRSLNVALEGKLGASNAKNAVLNELLDHQKKEQTEAHGLLNQQFKVIANELLDSKSAKLTELNQLNMKAILDPLSRNLTEFKQRVEEVYDKESKERFSLSEKVKELAQLNQTISAEAHNLSTALRGNAKTQGRWGEMILENILEKSGLTRGNEYFLESELRDDSGRPLYSDVEGKKMRPDAVIHYPGERSVIIDSKVSLNAYSRFMNSGDQSSQDKELAAHVAAIKGHIYTLSAKGYDDYDKSLDFTIMFIPIESAYNLAMQAEPDLWNFAYDKRILLLSPTNLITALKLIVDLWKRENQNKNAQKIAERGAKLYDKFVGFVDSLEQIGAHLQKANEKYEHAFKQLSTGNDNLILQVEKLKSLGLKTKKQLPISTDDELPTEED